MSEHQFENVHVRWVPRKFTWVGKCACQGRDADCADDDRNWEPLDQVSEAAERIARASAELNRRLAEGPVGAVPDAGEGEAEGDGRDV